MKQLVCVSKTPDTTTNIKLAGGGNEIDSTGVNYILNPYDEWYALVRAVELKAAVGGTITVINIGDSSNDTVIRKALAIGADDAVRIDMQPENALSVAKAIADHAREANYDIVYCGKESIDYNGSQVGAMIAEYLDLPFISLGIHMDLAGNTATIKRDIEGGTETVNVNTPFVLSCAKGMAEQRIPNMRDIMSSKRKPINVVTGENTHTTTTVSAYELPAGKASVKMIDPDNMDELVRLLKEEAKVL